MIAFLNIIPYTIVFASPHSGCLPRACQGGNSAPSVFARESSTAAIQNERI